MKCGRFLGKGTLLNRVNSFIYFNKYQSNNNCFFFLPFYYYSFNTKIIDVISKNDKLLKKLIIHRTSNQHPDGLKTSNVR
jgi:hypothetical protein